MEEIMKRRMEEVEEDNTRHTLREANTQIKQRKELERREQTIAKIDKLCNKLKRLSDTPLNVILDDLDILNLEMYLAEVVNSLVEGNAKLKDIPNLLLIVSKLHQEYAQLSTVVSVQLERSFASAASELSSVANRRKLLMRLTSELYLIGVIPDAHLIRSMVRDVCSSVASESLLLPHVSVLENYAKKLGAPMLGLQGTKRKAQEPIPRRCVAPPELARLLREGVQEFYTTNAEIRLREVHEAVVEQEKINSELKANKGELDPEHVQKYVSLNQAWERLDAQIISLADSLELEVPVYKNPVEEETVVRMVVNSEKLKIVNTVQDKWADATEKAFYEDLTDVRTLVPNLGNRMDASRSEEMREGEAKEEEPKPKKEEEVKKGGRGKKNDKSEKNEKNEKPEKEGKKGDDGRDGKKGGWDDPRKPKDAMDVLLQNFGYCDTAKDVDKLVLDFFSQQLNTRVNRKKLSKHIVNGKNDLHLLCFYGRFLGILNAVMKDTVQQICAEVIEVFKSYVESNDPMRIQVKLRAARVAGEFCKFAILPAGQALDLVDLCLKKFNSHHIEMACHLLQACGRFLLLSPLGGVGNRVRINLSSMMRHAETKAVPVALEMLLEETQVSVMGSGETKQARDEKSLMRRFIEALIFDAYPTKEGALQLIRKLDYSNSEVLTWARMAFLDLGYNMSIYTIAWCSELLSELAPHQPRFVVSCVDYLLESIMLSMERNDPTASPRRVREMLLLGELYAYRVVDTGLIFDMLYHLIGFGGRTSIGAGHVTSPHILWKQSKETQILGVQGYPIHDPKGPFDPAFDFIRIRLICSLMGSVYEYFRQGPSRWRIMRYYIFLRMYLFLKGDVPLSTWNGIEATLDLYNLPKSRVTDYASGWSLVQKVLKEEGVVMARCQDTHEDYEKALMMSPTVDREVRALEESIPKPVLVPSGRRRVLDLRDLRELNLSKDRPQEKSEDEEFYDEEDEEIVPYDSDDDEAARRKLDELETEKFEDEFQQMVKDAMNYSRANTTKEELRLPPALAFPDPNASPTPVEGVRQMRVVMRRQNQKFRVKKLDVPSDTKIATAHVEPPPEPSEEEKRHIKQFILEATEADDDIHKLEMEFGSRFHIRKKR